VPDGRRTDWAGVALGLAVASLAAFQMLKLAPALPVLIADYGYGRVLAGAMMSVYAAAALVLSLAAGGLLARRPAATLGGGLACMVAGNLVTLAVPDSGAVVLACRALEGVGYAVLGIAGPVIANRSAAERHFPIVAGIVAIWVPIGQITALVAARLTLDSHGWQPLWWLSLLLTAVVGLWMALRRDDVVVAMSAIARAGQARWSGRETAALWLAAAVFALWGGQYLAFMTWLPDHMVDRHGIAPQQAALLNLVPVLSVAASCLATGWMLRRGAPFGVLFVVATLSQVPVWLFAADLPGAWGLAAIAFFGLACGVTPTLLFALPPRLLGGHRVGPAAFAPMMTGRNCGLLVAPVVAGWIVTDWGWEAMGPVFGAVTFVAAAGGGVMAWLAAKRP
jgi:MFS family permease